MISIGSVSWNNQDILDNLQKFSELYKTRPLKDNHGGMLSPHMFYTWFLAKQGNYDNVIESGIWKGQSTWLFEKALPKADIYSIDIHLEFRKYISKNVIYFNKDFQTIDWNNLDKSKTLCFFDDHQDALPRIKYAKKHGFKFLVFEDNYPIGQGDCISLKQLLEKGGKEAEYLNKTLKIYYEFPPIFKNPKNRWGIKWEDYPIKKSLLDKPNQEYMKIYKKEAHNYNWLCFVELY